MADLGKDRVGVVVASPTNTLFQGGGVHQAGLLWLELAGLILIFQF